MRLALDAYAWPPGIYTFARSRRAFERAFAIAETLVYRIEVLQPSLDNERRLDTLRDRLQRLVTVARNRDHHALVGIDTAGGDKFQRHGEGGAAGRLGEDALGAGE